MEIKIFESKDEMGMAAAQQGATFINNAIIKKGFANIIVATGASQFETLKYLIEAKIDWQKVRAFHLDEYIGLPITHPASFRKYLKERFVSKVPLMEFNYIDGEADIVQECARLNGAISKFPIDVAFVGIGENGHLAFNDPPADFDVEDPYIEVDLDEKCRLQQLGEGWFNNFGEIPERAISMSVRQILKSEYIICSVPDERKAEAVQKVVLGDVTPAVPASVLKDHSNTFLYLDKFSGAYI